jgi:hypothetical protein
LLTQNLSGSARPANSFPWWKQSDESYYIAKAKQVAEFLSNTRDGYYIVEETSSLRLKFKCPKFGSVGAQSLYYGHKDQAPANFGSISIYINPTNDQASWICPKCTMLNSTACGGDGHPVKHTISRELRADLVKDGVIPEKEFKYADRLAETDKLLKVIRENPGSSFYELDHLMGWDSDGRISERIINQQLKKHVDLKKGRKHKGFKVYIKK